MGRGQVGAEVGVLTQPAETMGWGLTQRVGMYQQREKKKKLTSQDADRGDVQKKGVQGASDTWKRVSAKKKKRMQMKKKLMAGGGADVGSGAQTKQRMKNRLGI